MQQELSSASMASLSMYFVILNHMWARGVVNWQRTEWKVLSSVMVGGVRDREAAHAVGVPLGRGWESHCLTLSPGGQGGSLEMSV